MTADQQPTSPGATDPRPKAAIDALQDDENDFGVWRTNTTIVTLALAAADAADRAADPPWIRIRCDEATVELVARLLVRQSYSEQSGHGWSQRDARAVLAALRGE